MPHKVGSKWKWGNVERSSKKELAQTVYGIWKKNGSKGDFGDFWRSGKVSESYDRSNMLDFQVNSRIQEAYRKVCEGANDVPSNVSMPVKDISSAEDGRSIMDMDTDDYAEMERKAERDRRREEARRAEMLRQQNQTFMSAKEAPDIDKDRPKLVNADEHRLSLQRVSGKNDPGMRIGRGAYQGIGYMLPGAILGKMSSAAKVGNTVKNAVRTKNAAEKAAKSTGFFQKYGNRILTDVPIGYGLEKSTELLDSSLDKLTKNTGVNFNAARPALDTASEFAQWTRSPLYKIGQTFKHVYDETQDEINGYWGCKICGEEFDTEDKWLKHMKYEHNKVPVDD